MNRSNINKRGYDGLLDKYLDSSQVNQEMRKAREEEAKNRYGNLLENAKPNYKIYDTILNINEGFREQRRKEAEELELRRQQHLEKEKRETQECIDRNKTFVNSYLEKKEAKETEKKAVERKRKEDAEKVDFYKNVEKLMDINPHLAETYIKTQRRF